MGLKLKESLPDESKGINLKLEIHSVFSYSYYNPPIRYKKILS